MQGHDPDKLELILEGGTYTEYPVEYLEDFHCRLFYVANTYYDNIPKREMLSIAEEMNMQVARGSKWEPRGYGICPKNGSLYTLLFLTKWSLAKNPVLCVPLSS